jgi:hypothetical protein
MTVKELKELLNQFNDNDLIIMSKDSEGNRYSPLSSLEEISYEAESSWEGIVGIRELTNEYIEAGYSEEDLVENGVNAVALYPVN